MPKKKSELIKVSGNAGSSGQSFRNHVTSAGSGVGARSYLTTDWSSGGWPTGSYGFARRHVIALAHTQGSRAHLIKSTGNIVTVSDVSPGGASVTVENSDIVAADNGSSAIVRVQSSLTPIGTVSGTKGPTSTPTDVPWEIEFGVQVSGTATDSEVVTFTLRHWPDAGGGAHFSPELTRIIAATYSDLIDLDSIEVQWSEDGVGFDSTNGYDNIYDTGKTFTWNQDHVGEDKTFYLAYRRYASATWVNIGAVFYEDTRAEI